MNKLFKIILLISMVYTIENNAVIDLSKMSLKEKIAQMIMVRVNGEFYNNEDWRKKTVLKLIKNYNIGGLISYTGSTHGTFYNIKIMNYNAIDRFQIRPSGVGYKVDCIFLPDILSI